MTDIANIITRLEVATATLEKRVEDRYDNILLSCNEAARHLGCTSSTVTRMLKDGRLRRTTIAGSTGIRLSDVLELKTP